MKRGGEMKIERLQEILDAYGADPGRWPEGERSEALAFVAQSADGKRRLDEARRLDALLDTVAATVTLGLTAESIVAGVERATRNVRRLPRKSAFAPSFGWPQLAGLAAAAAAGLIAGWLGLATDYFGYETSAQTSELSVGQALTEVEPW